MSVKWRAFEKNRVWNAYKKSKCCTLTVAKLAKYFSKTCNPFSICRNQLERFFLCFKINNWNESRFWLIWVDFVWQSPRHSIENRSMWNDLAAQVFWACSFQPTAKLNWPNSWFWRSCHCTPYIEVPKPWLLSVARALSASHFWGSTESQSCYVELYDFRRVHFLKEAPRFCRP